MDNAIIQLQEIGRWIDRYNEWRHPEAQDWGRIAKIGEEFGEAIAAYIGASGQNPRKGITHTYNNVNDELLDVALTALSAYDHMTHNKGLALPALIAHIDKTYKRIEEVGPMLAQSV